MSLVVNTNVSSLTAQRALAYADSLQGEAMTRLSTGSKINSASDDAAGLAIAQRMTAQVSGINMAVKNANDGIAMTKSVEGALVEVSDMLQRMRELSVQAANDTNVGTDRVAIQEEIDLLKAEITRVSENTRFNNQLVLDGSFTNKRIQVGTEGGEAIGISVGSSASNALGAYSITGDRVEANLGNGSGVRVNDTDSADHILLNGRGVSKTIDVAVDDSAKNVAAKINAISGETGVSATAKTYAHLSSEKAVDETVSLFINGTRTGNFVFSKSNVTDAIAKINAVSGQTGVSASATNDSKVRLYSADGSDILIENADQSSTSMRVQTVGHDGESVMPAKVWHRAVAETAATAGVAHVYNSDLGTIADFDHAANTATMTATDGETTLTFTIAGGAGNQSMSDIITGLTTGSNTAAYANFAYTITDDGANDLLFTAKAVGVQQAENKPVVAVSGGASNTITAAADKTAGKSAQLSALAGTYTLVQKSTGATYTFDPSVSPVNGTTGKFTAQNIEDAINGINGVSGFKAAATTDSLNDVTVTAAESFGDFEIYKGTNTEDATQLQTSVGRAQVTTVVASTIDDGDVISLTNDSTGETYSFTMTGLTSADALQSALRTATGDDGFTVYLATGLTDVDPSSTTTAGSTLYQIHGSKDFGAFTLKETTNGGGGGAATFTSRTTGDQNLFDVSLAAGGSANDSATVQGSLALSSSHLFSVTQQDEDSAAPTDPNIATGSLLNDNYFTTQSAQMSTVSNISLLTQAGADAALAVIDGAIEKISSMRSSLGAIENRLDHTISNLMNVSEQTSAARSAIEDADFAAESAKLAKAQVLKQAGVGMLSQANASSQLVLQLLQ
jgi:flagellin